MIGDHDKTTKVKNTARHNSPFVLLAGFCFVASIMRALLLSHGQGYKLILLLYADLSTGDN